MLNILIIIGIALLAYWNYYQKFFTAFIHLIMVVCCGACVPLVYALRAQLERILDREGLSARFERHLAMRAATLEWARTHGFELLVEPAFQSPTVSTIRASGHDVSELIATAKAAGFTLGNGYGKLKGETFRIGHMGDHEIPRLAALLAAITP